MDFFYLFLVSIGTGQIFFFILACIYVLFHGNSRD